MTTKVCYILASHILTPPSPPRKTTTEQQNTHKKNPPSTAMSQKTQWTHIGLILHLLHRVSGQEPEGRREGVALKQGSCRLQSCGEGQQPLPLWHQPLQAHWTWGVTTSVKGTVNLQCLCTTRHQSLREHWTWGVVASAKVTVSRQSKCVTSRHQSLQTASLTLNSHSYNNFNELAPWSKTTTSISPSWLQPSSTSEDKLRSEQTEGVKTDQCCGSGAVAVGRSRAWCPAQSPQPERLDTGGTGCAAAGPPATLMPATVTLPCNVLIKMVVGVSMLLASEHKTTHKIYLPDVFELENKSFFLSFNLCI